MYIQIRKRSLQKSEEDFPLTFFLSGISWRFAHIFEKGGHVDGKFDLAIVSAFNQMSVAENSPGTGSHSGNPAARRQAGDPVQRRKRGISGQTGGIYRFSGTGPDSAAEGAGRAAGTYLPLFSLCVCGGAAPGICHCGRGWVWRDKPSWKGTGVFAR